MMKKIGGTEQVVEAMQRLNGTIRRRLSTFVENTRSSLIELRPESRWPGQLLLVTAQALEQLPGVDILYALLTRTQEAVKQLLTGNQERMIKGIQLLMSPAQLEESMAFVASLMSKSDPGSRSVLTFCYDRQQFQFVRTEEVCVVRTDEGLELAVMPHGVFHMP